MSEEVGSALENHVACSPTALGLALAGHRSAPVTKSRLYLQPFNVFLPLEGVRRSSTPTAVDSASSPTAFSARER